MEILASTLFSSSHTGCREDYLTWSQRNVASLWLGRGKIFRRLLVSRHQHNCVHLENSQRAHGKCGESAHFNWRNAWQWRKQGIVSYNIHAHQLKIVRCSYCAKRFWKVRERKKRRAGGKMENRKFSFIFVARKFLLLLFHISKLKWIWKSIRPTNTNLREELLRQIPALSSAPFVRFIESSHSAPQPPEKKFWPESS